jgi:hypothetical protein
MDNELFSSIRRELFSAVFGDVMDQLGLRHQFLPPSIQPLLLDWSMLQLIMPPCLISD